MKWNVYRYDSNRHNMVVWNIFNHSGFRNDVQQALHNQSISDEEFEEVIQRSLQYFFWSRCEYEVLLASWPSEEISEKTDIFQQVMINWEHFIAYLKQLKGEYNENTKV